VRCTLMPEVSADPGFSPTDRVRRHQMVWNSSTHSKTAGHSAAYVNSPLSNNTGPTSGMSANTGIRSFGVIAGST